MNKQNNEKVLKLSGKRVVRKFDLVIINKLILMLQLWINSWRFRRFWGIPTQL